MALNEQLKTNLKANTEYYKSNKDKSVTPEWGFPSTLDQIESELQKSDISTDDKKVLLDWMDAFSQIKIENDTTAEARREKLKNEMQKLRGIVAIPAPAAATGAPASTVNTNNTAKTPESVKTEIESALSEITEGDFNSLKSSLEKAQGIVSGFEKIQPQYREGMRGALGLMIIERLSKAGYNVTLQGNTINVTSAKAENQSRATQMETYFRGQVGMSENLALGMIYRSSEIKNYSEVYLNADKKSIKPETPRNYIDYLKDSQGKSGKVQNPNDQAIEQSRSAIQSILSDPNKVKGIIIGTPFLASSFAAMQADPQLQQLAQSASQSLTPVGVPAQGSNVVNVTPATTTVVSSGKLPDWDKDPVNRILGEVGTGFSGGVNKLMSTPGAFGGLLLATIATMIFGDFKKGLMVFAAGFGLSGIVDIVDRNMPGIKNTANATAQAATNAGNAVTAAASSAAAAAGIPGATPASPAAGPANAPSPYQSDLRKKVEANTSLSQDIEKLSTSQGSKYPGKLDDYLKFIETDLKDVPLSKLFPSDHKKSIFFDNFDTDFSVDSKLSGKMLKKVLREYLTGNIALTGTGDKLGEKEQTDFLALQKITPADLASKKLSDILESVHKARTAGAAAAQAPAQTTPTVPATVATPAIAPAGAPAATVATGMTTVTTHKIGNIDKNVGDNVETTVNAPTFAADGSEYKNPGTKLKTDAAKIVYIPTGGIVKLGSTTITRYGVVHLEVEYAGEKVYVLPTYLKP